MYFAHIWHKIEKSSVLNFALFALYYITNFALLTQQIFKGSVLEKIPYYAFFQALSLQILLASLTLSLKNKCPCSFLCFLDKNDSKNLRIRKFWDLYEYEILNNAKKKSLDTQQCIPNFYLVTVLKRLSIIRYNGQFWRFSKGNGGGGKCLA